MTASPHRTARPIALGFALLAAFLPLGGIQAQPAANPSPTLLAGEEQAPIILYTTSWCGYCRKTRALLDQLGEPYIDKDIEKDPQGRAEYQKKGRGYTGVPLIDAGGKILRGYDEKSLRSIVRERQEERGEEL